MPEDRSEEIELNIMSPPIADAQSGNAIIMPRCPHRDRGDERLDSWQMMSSWQVRCGRGPSGEIAADLYRERKRVVKGQSVLVRVDLGDRRIFQKNKTLITI